MSCFGIMEGYLDRPDLTASMIRDGWLHTGDVVERKGDMYFVRGRVGDRINRGGQKFDPLEVEEVASVVAGVTGAVACAIPHPVLGEDVALAVEVAAGHDLDAVREAVAQQLSDGLPRFKVPRDIRAVREMPRAPLGKPQRRAVAEWFTEAPVVDAARG
jgi:acyl-CoA synthetase (AMP-forming)/AMP-acid ligase II